jgi:hypothetical protein
MLGGALAGSSSVHVWADAGTDADTHQNRRQDTISRSRRTTFIANLQLQGRRRGILEWRLTFRKR